MMMMGEDQLLTWKTNASPKQCDDGMCLLLTWDTPLPEESDGE